jgi:hypothetical protein
MNTLIDHSPASAANAMRDEFGMARAILEYSIRENIAGFTLSGLKIPRVIQCWGPGTSLPESADFVLEVAIFQEHLADRITALSQNRKLLGLCALSGHRFTVAIGDSKGHESVGIEFNAV